MTIPDAITDAAAYQHALRTRSVATIRPWRRPTTPAAIRAVAEAGRTCDRPKPGEWVRPRRHRSHGRCGTGHRGPVPLGSPTTSRIVGTTRTAGWTGCIARIAMPRAWSR